MIPFVALLIIFLCRATFASLILEGDSGDCSKFKEIINKEYKSLSPFTFDQSVPYFSNCSPLILAQHLLECKDHANVRYLLKTMPMLTDTLGVQLLFTALSTDDGHLETIFDVQNASALNPKNEIFSMGLFDGEVEEFFKMAALYKRNGWLLQQEELKVSNTPHYALIHRCNDRESKEHDRKELIEKFVSFYEHHLRLFFYYLIFVENKVVLEEIIRQVDVQREHITGWIVLSTCSKVVSQDILKMLVKHHESSYVTNMLKEAIPLIQEIMKASISVEEKSHKDALDLLQSDMSILPRKKDKKVRQILKKICEQSAWTILRRKDILPERVYEAISLAKVSTESALQELAEFWALCPPWLDSGKIREAITVALKNSKHTLDNTVLLAFLIDFYTKALKNEFGCLQHAPSLEDLPRILAETKTAPKNDDAISSAKKVRLAAYALEFDSIQVAQNLPLKDLPTFVQLYPKTPALLAVCLLLYKFSNCADEKIPETFFASFDVKAIQGEELLLMRYGRYAFNCLKYRRHSELGDDERDDSPVRRQDLFYFMTEVDVLLHGTNNLHAGRLHHENCFNFLRSLTTIDDVNVLKRALQWVVVQTKYLDSWVMLFLCAKLKPQVILDAVLDNGLVKSAHCSKSIRVLQKLVTLLDELDNGLELSKQPKTNQDVLEKQKTVLCYLKSKEPDTPLTQPTIREYCKTERFKKLYGMVLSVQPTYLLFCMLGRADVQKDKVLNILEHLPINHSTIHDLVPFMRNSLVFKTFSLEELAKTLKYDIKKEACVKRTISDTVDGLRALATVFANFYNSQPVEQKQSHKPALKNKKKTKRKGTRSECKGEILYTTDKKIDFSSLPYMEAETSEFERYARDLISMLSPKNENNLKRDQLAFTQDLHVKKRKKGILVELGRIVPGITVQRLPVLQVTSSNSSDKDVGAQLQEKIGLQVYIL